MMSSRRNELLVVICMGLASVLSAACDKKPEQKPALKPPVASDRQSEDAKALSEFLNKDAKAPAGGALPQGHPPIEGSTPAPATTGTMPPGHPPMGGANAPVAPAGPELKYEVPTDWQPMPVKSPLRKAQYRMPGATSTDDGEMVVFFFGANQGGSVEANLLRWRGFFTTPEGKAIPDDSVRSEKFDVGNLKVTTIDVAGRYSDTTMSPDAKPIDKTMRMLGAIVETPGGNWFFKGVGPVETMQTHREAFEGMLRTAKQ